MASLAYPLVGSVTWQGWYVERTESLLAFPDHDFEQFFTANYERLVRSLSAITGDRETASDCVQEAFVKAASRWRKVSRLEDPAGWVRRVAINKSRDVHRANTRRLRRENANELATSHTRETGYIEDQGSLELRALLDELPPQQRAVTALFYLDDLRVADVAETLGLSAGAVKFHLHKARESLRVVLECGMDVDENRIRRDA